MTSFPRPALLTHTSCSTSICHDLEDSSPKSGLNYSLWLRATQPPFPPLPKTPVPQEKKGKKRKKKHQYNRRGSGSSPRQPLNISGFQTPPGSLSAGCSAPCPCFSLEDCLFLYGLTVVLFMGISLEQVPHWSNNLHVRWITWLLINDTIDTFTSEIQFL